MSHDHASNSSSSSSPAPSPFPPSSSSPSPSLIHSIEFIPRLAYLLLVVIATIFGNLLVIVAVAKFQKLRRSTNLLLASLALADLMSGIVTVPLYIAWTVNPEIFDKSAFMCRFVLLSCLLLVAASQVSLLLLSLERYLAVCQPFKHRHLLLHCPWIHKCAICFIWLVSGLATGTSSFAIRTDYVTCSYYGVFDKIFLFLAVIFGIFIMFLAIIVINIKVLYSVRDHERRFSVVEASTFGDHRHSSYLCHQDAFDSHIGPPEVVCANNSITRTRPSTTTTISARVSTSVSSTIKDEDCELVGSQPMLKYLDGGSKFEILDADNADGRVTQRSGIFLPRRISNRSGRGSYPGGYQCQYLKDNDRRNSLKVLNRKSLRMKLRWDDNDNDMNHSRSVNDIGGNNDETVETSALITEEEYFTDTRRGSFVDDDGDDNDNVEDVETSLPKSPDVCQTFVNRSSLPNILESFGISSNGMNISGNQLKSLDHLVKDSGSSKMETFCKENTQMNNNNNTNYDNDKNGNDKNDNNNLKNSTTKSTGKNSVDAVVAAITEYPLPVSFELNQIFQTCLNSPWKARHSKSIDAVLNSSSVDDSSIGVNDALTPTQYYNAQSKSLNCVQCSPQRNKNTTTTNSTTNNNNSKNSYYTNTRMRKLAKCYPDHFNLNLRQGWKENKGKSDIGQYSDCHNENIVSCHREQEKDSILNSMPNTVIQNSSTGNDVSNDSSTSCGRLQYLHLETGLCAQTQSSKGVISLVQNNTALIGMPSVYSVSLQNIQHAHGVNRDSKGGDINDNGCDVEECDVEEDDVEEGDDYHVTNSWDNCLDNRPLIRQSRSSPSKHLKANSNKHSPTKHLFKLPRRFKDNNNMRKSKSHQSSYDISKFESETTLNLPGNSHHHLLKSVPNLTTPQATKKDFIPEALSNFLNPLPFVSSLTLPMSRSCPRICADQTQPQIKYAPSSAIPSYNNNNKNNIFQKRDGNYDDDDDDDDNDDVFDRDECSPVSSNTRSNQHILTGSVHDCRQSFNKNLDVKHVENERKTNCDDNINNDEKCDNANNNDRTDHRNNHHHHHHQSQQHHHQHQHQQQRKRHDNLNQYHNQDKNLSTTVTTTTTIATTTTNAKPPNHQPRTSNASNCSSIITTTSNRYHKISNISNRSSVSNHHNNNYSSHFSNDARRKSSSVTKQRNAYISKKVARTVTIVCASFILAWLPFFVVIIYNTFCAQCNLDYALNAVLMVAFGQSACNPVIYALYHASFRRAYKSLLKQLCSTSVCLVQCSDTNNCARKLHDVLESE